MHKSKVVQDKMAELDLGCIFNASYSPDYNPIEGVFSIVKLKIKQQRLKALAKGVKTNIEFVIDNAFREVSLEAVQAHVNHSHRLLKQAV